MSVYDLTLDKKIDMVRMSIRAVTRGYKQSRLISGSAGIGKSYAVLDEIKNEIESLKEDGKYLSYELVTGGIKDAVSFYTMLNDNNRYDHIILLDDVNTVLTDKECREMLRSATTNEVIRRINYSANKIVKGKTFYRPKMDFVAKIIIITNIPKQKIQRIDSGILSRTSPIEIIAKPNEIFDWVGMNLENAPPHDLPLKWKQKVFDFIKEEIVDKKKLKLFDFRVFEDSCLWLASCLDKKLIKDEVKLTLRSDDWKNYVYSFCT
jgi:hypothetical protein